jgi:hypothetical protein
VFNHEFFRNHVLNLISLPRLVKREMFTGKASPVGVAVEVPQHLILPDQMHTSSQKTGQYLKSRPPYV